MSQRFQWRIMGAEDSVRLEVFQMTFESRSRIAWKQPLYSVEPPGELWIVSLFEHHPPKFGSAFNELYVAVRNDLSVEWRKELHQINSLDSVLRMVGSPRFLQSRGSSHVSSTSRHRCNQYSHRVPDV